MSERGIFRTPEARQTMLDWYERFATRVPAGATRREVDTRIGRTHVLSAGPADGPPLVIFHGAMASSAHMLAEVPTLCDTFRVHAVDIVGQSVKSAEVRPPVKGPAYAEWATDVMDALALARAAVLAVSWGGFVALRLARYAPERVDKLALLVPAGLVTGPAWAGFTQVGWPIMRYRRGPTEARLQRALRSLVTTTGDPDWVGYLGDAFRGYLLDFRVPPRVRPGELAGFDRPTLVIGADKDLSFPGGKLIARAREVLPGAVETELLQDCRHCPPFDDTFRDWLGKRVGAFLAGPAAE